MFSFDSAEKHILPENIKVNKTTQKSFIVLCCIKKSCIYKNLEQYINIKSKVQIFFLLMQVLFQEKSILPLSEAHPIRNIGKSNDQLQAFLLKPV